MALVTRCSNPGCLTLFRVTPAQLQAFGGQVRCGNCSVVFDAFPSLTTVADSALKAPESLPSGIVAEDLAQADSPAAQQDAAEERPAAADIPVDDPGPEAADRVAEDRSAPAFGAGETVSEWTMEGAQPTIDARSPSPPMPVDRVPDLPPEGAQGFVDAPASASTDADAAAPLPDADRQAPAFAPETGPIEAQAPPALHVDPVPQIAPELTDYSVTPGPPPRAAPAASRTRLLLVFGGLLLAVAFAAMMFAGDRLPAPLARLFAPAALATLLREHALTVAVALVALLCWVLRRYRTTWILAALVLSLLLAGQLVFAYRTQIAAFYPATRPLLEQACRVARCEVGLPKAADQLVIESSDLQAVDAAKPNLIQLAASVRNRAAIEVAFPAIEVTLTDAQDRPLARRVLLPDQYLAGRQTAGAGLRAGEDFSIRLTLDTTELRPVGYRLYLFYP